MTTEEPDDADYGPETFADLLPGDTQILRGDAQYVSQVNAQTGVPNHALQVEPMANGDFRVHNSWAPSPGSSETYQLGAREAASAIARGYSIALPQGMTTEQFFAQSDAAMRAAVNQRQAAPSELGTEALYGSVRPHASNARVAEQPLRMQEMLEVVRSVNTHGGITESVMAATPPAVSMSSSTPATSNRTAPMFSASGMSVVTAVTIIRMDYIPDSNPEYFVVMVPAENVCTTVSPTIWNTDAERIRRGMPGTEASIDGDNVFSFIPVGWAYLRAFRGEGTDALVKLDLSQAVECGNLALTANTALHQANVFKQQFLEFAQSGRESDRVLLTVHPARLDVASPTGRAPSRPPPMQNISTRGTCSGRSQRLRDSFISSAFPIDSLQGDVENAPVAGDNGQGIWIPADFNVNRNGDMYAPSGLEDMWNEFRQENLVVDLLPRWRDEAGLTEEDMDGLLRLGVSRLEESGNTYLSSQLSNKHLKKNPGNSSVSVVITKKVLLDWLSELPEGPVEFIVPCADPNTGDDLTLIPLGIHKRTSGTANNKNFVQLAVKPTEKVVELTAPPLGPPVEGVKDVTKSVG